MVKVKICAIESLAALGLCHLIPAACFKANPFEVLVAVSAAAPSFFGPVCRFILACRGLACCWYFCSERFAEW